MFQSIVWFVTTFFALLGGFSPAADVTAQATDAAPMIVQARTAVRDEPEGSVTTMAPVVATEDPVVSAPDPMKTPETTVTVIITDVSGPRLVERVEVYLPDGRILTKPITAPGDYRFTVPAGGEYLIARAGVMDGTMHMSATCPDTPRLLVEGEATTVVC